MFHGPTSIPVRMAGKPQAPLMRRWHVQTAGRVLSRGVFDAGAALFFETGAAEK